MVRRPTHFFALIVAILMLNPSFSFAGSTKIQIVSTFSVLSDFAKEIGGENVDVITLVDPDHDVHDYEPRTTDIKALSSANLVLENGLGLENWISRLVAVSKTKAVAIVASNGVTPIEMDEAGKKIVDPHAWQSISNAKMYVRNIAAGLSKADPNHQDDYYRNAELYVSRLDQLESQVRSGISQIPEPKRKIITTHDAFGYFGKEYGFQFIAPQGVSTEAEASAADVAKIIRQIKSDNIPAVFLENVTDSRLIKQIASETGAKIGGTLYSDSLSNADGPASSYIDMMRNNIQVLRTALTE